MSVENKTLAKKLAKAQRKQQQQLMDRVHSSHDVSAKDSQNDVLIIKKPFLKKRSGLFRFYKCLPHSHHHHHRHHNEQHRQRANTNSNRTSNDFSIKNSRGVLNSNVINHGINTPLSHSHRSTTYNPNPTVGETQRVIKGHQLSHPHPLQQHQQQKRDQKSSPEVKIFEILDDDGNGTEKYCTTAPTVSSLCNIKIDPAGFEQGDTHNLLNCHSNLNLSSHLLKSENESPRTFQPIQTGVEKDASRIFGCNSTGNAGRGSEDFHNTNLDLPDMSHCFDEEEDDEQENDNESEGENMSESSEDNFTMNPSHANHQQLSMSNQLSELQSELMGIKNKVADLEKNVKTEDGRKTSIVKENKNTGLSLPKTEEGLLGNIGIIQSKKQQQQQETTTNFVNTTTTCSDSMINCTKSSYKNVIEGIHTGLDRINTELNDLQTSFLQKMEGLEEEIHIKSQRWCENQIKMVDQVHSLFSELELLKDQVKAQQHQVQNLAENVEKEFVTAKSEWRESQEALQNRVKALEDQNYKLLIENVQQNNNNCSTNAISTEELDRVENIKSKFTKPSIVLTDMSNPILSSHQHPIQVCNQGSQVSPTSLFNEDSMNDKSHSSLHINQSYNQSSIIEPKLETIGGQIVSARKTLANGDMETVYTNGTREIIKSDKSEIRHMYRNGDVRTVTTQDGTITYFYASSSTWQTTYATGVELFKFPNGVVERRLPNGFIEQTDVEGRVTFFQATPPKPSNGLLPVATILKTETDTMTDPQKYGPSKQPNINVGVGGVAGPIKMTPGERIIVFENGEEEIHGADYRKRIFSDGTVKTVYKDGSQETRYPNGRIRIKDGDGNLVADISPDKIHHSNKTSKLVRDFGANTNNQC